MAENTYLMVRTSATDLLTGGMVGQLERSVDSIAKFYLYNYCEEDLSRMRGSRQRDTIIENNDVVKKLISRFRSGKIALENTKTPGKVVQLEPSNSDHAKFITLVLLKIPNKNGSLPNGVKREQAIRSKFYLALMLGLKPDDKNLQDILPDSELPYKAFNIKSFGDFEKFTPDVWKRMGEVYGESKSKFDMMMSKLSNIRIPGSTGSNFNLKEFSVDALSRKTSSAYFKNAFGVRRVIKSYLPKLFGSAITPEESEKISTSFGIDLSTGMQDLAKNVPNFHGYFARPHGIVPGSDSIMNFLKTFEVIVSYGEKIKFKGGLHDVLKDNMNKYINIGALAQEDESISNSFTEKEEDIKNNILLSLSNGVIGKYLNNPVVITAKVKKGKGAIRKLAGGGDRPNIAINVSGAAFIRPASLLKAKKEISKLLADIGINMPGAEIIFTLPEGRYP